MSDFYLVDPQGWEYDLQSVYSAYMGYFQLHAVPWHDQSWGQFFETFQQFLTFSWPVVTVTDTRTSRAHIVTRMSSITAFVRMIKTRFGETLPMIDNVLLVKPLEISQRHMRHVNDWSTYKKLHATLPAVALASFRARVRAGDPVAIRELWATRDKTFLALDFECLESNANSNGNSDGGHRSPSSSYVTITEWGYAVIRSSHLVAAGAWPPVPDENYRKGHYIISERATSNALSGGNESAKSPPTSVSWQYAFGDSQVVSKAKLPRIIQCVLSSLLSPDSESVANDVVLVGHGVHTVLQRLEEMKIKLPSNVLILDVAYLERALYNSGERGPMVSRKTGASRLSEALLTLGGVLHAIGIPLPSKGCALHNAGNDAFMTLVAFQRMVDARGGVGIGGEAGVRPGAGIGTGTGTGVKGEHAKGDANASTQGHGHVKRAATVAARFFRTGNGNKDVPAQPQAQTQNQNQKGHMRAQSQSRARASVSRADEMGVVVHPPSLKRASMMSTRTTMTTATTMTTKTAATTKPAATTKSAVTTKTSKASRTLMSQFRWAETDAEEKVNEKVKQNDGNDNEKTSTNGSGSGSGTASGIQNGGHGWWIPPLSMSMSPSMSPPSSIRVNGGLGGLGGHPHQWQQSTLVEMQRV